MYIELTSKCDIKNARKLDIESIHGDYKTAIGTRTEIMAYISKETNPIV